MVFAHSVLEKPQAYPYDVQLMVFDQFDKLRVTSHFEPCLELVERVSRNP
jgi:hypothetical protein